MIQTLRRYQPSAAQHREVWALAWPLMLSSITVPLLGLVDTAVIGHLPDGQHLAAVAIGAMIFSILYWAFGFLRMGTTGMTAQAFGEEDGTKNRRLLAQSLVMGSVIGLFILVLQTPIIELALQLMDAAPEVTAEARQYAQWRILGAPAVLCNYALLGWFVGNQNTRIPLLLLLVTNLSNMLLDIIAVYGLGMFADGIAAATVIAEYLSLALGLYLSRRILRRTSGQLERQRLWRWADYYQLIVLNRYLFVRTLAILFALAFFTAQGAQQSTVILSANAVLLNFLLIISNGLDGFAHACEALAGRFTGARDRDGFYRANMAALQWALVAAAGFTLVFWLGGSLIIQLLTSIEPVQQAALSYLPWIWLLPVCGVWSFLLDGIFIGTTQVKAMQHTMLLSVFGVYLPVWYLSQPLGNHGLWLAFIALFLARGLSGALVYGWLCRHNRWFSHQAHD